MRYHFEITPRVRQYLSDLSLLTREGRIKLSAGISSLSEAADQFRIDPANRLGPDSRYFRAQYIFADGGKVRMLTLVIDDSAAAYGVLVVEYAECT